MNGALVSLAIKYRGSIIKSCLWILKHSSTYIGSMICFPSTTHSFRVVDKEKRFYTYVIPFLVWNKFKTRFVVRNKFETCLKQSSAKFIWKQVSNSFVCSRHFRVYEKFSMYWSQDPDTRDKVAVFHRFLKDSVVVLDYEEEDVAEIISISNSIVKRARKRRNFDLYPFLVWN